MRLRPADLAAIAEFNAGTARAVAANRAPGPDTVPRLRCACGAYTRSPNGICRACSKETR